MLVYAGKTYSARYDKKAPIHIAVVDPDAETGVRALCHDMEISPVNERTVDVTCRNCESEIYRIMASLELAAG